MSAALPTLDERPLPDTIERLRELAYNLWWSWHPEALALFERLDPLLSQAVGNNPVGLLRRVDDDKLASAASDPAYLARYRAVMRQFDAYVGESDTWFATSYPDLTNAVIAYFSTEFGLHESLPLYAGGLGILSGDHCKEASDLGLPFVGVGLLYHQGYFSQKLDEGGWQHPVYLDLIPEDRPLRRSTTPDGGAVQVSFELNGLHIQSDVWQVHVGRVPLYLLDTQVESNQPEVCQPMSRLYGGSRETRLLQEALLGIGGVRALRALGIEPTVWHLNEGHSAFSTLEIARERVAGGASTDEALAAAKAATVFTTHTPVPAGLDTFEFGLVERYFGVYWEALGLDRDSFFDLARQTFDWGERFSMPRLALRLSSLRNGVSKLHGEVSRQLFHSLWPDRKVDDVPIGHVTNGVHVETWLAPQMVRLFHDYVGEDWIEAQDEPEIWRAVAAIPDEALWAARAALKAQLIRFLHDKAQRRWSAGETTPRHVLWSGALLSPHALTIGFARRFATYKRATLLFHDMERLKRIVTPAERPVQFVFAGKAHPDDDAGKHLIQHICRVALQPEMAGRVAFVEDYDMQAGRMLTQGVDLWLNNPRRPREASGTSGQKAAMNGVPNLSILDGWWAEGFDGHNGWAIGGPETLDDEAAQDAGDAAALYDALENEVVPLYYQRDHDGLPLGWLARVRASIQTTLPQFSTRRMVKEYAQGYYVPLMRR